jgi:hypothetical protein
MRQAREKAGAEFLAEDGVRIRGSGPQSLASFEDGDDFGLRKLIPPQLNEKIPAKGLKYHAKL